MVCKGPSGNNGAKRKEYFIVKTVEEDVYPENVDADACTF